MSLFSLLLALVAVLLIFGFGVVIGRAWAKLEERVRRSENEYDDRVFFAAERLSDRLIEKLFEEPPVRKPDADP